MNGARRAHFAGRAAGTVPALATDMHAKHLMMTTALALSLGALSASAGKPGPPSGAKPAPKLNAVKAFKRAVKGTGTWQFGSDKCNVTQNDGDAHWRYYSIANTTASASEKHPRVLRLTCQDGSECMASRDSGRASQRKVRLPQKTAADAAKAWNKLAALCRLDAE